MVPAELCYSAVEERLVNWQRRTACTSFSAIRWYHRFDRGTETMLGSVN